MRITVRERPASTLYTAFQLDKRQVVALPNGKTVAAQKGEWVITKGPAVVNIVPADIFDHTYELADEDALVLASADRAAVEAVLGIGSTHDSSRLVGAVIRLARLTIGEIAIDFTPGQWEELHHRATKRGMTIETFMEQLVARITQDIWSVG